MMAQKKFIASIFVSVLTLSASNALADEGTQTAQTTNKSQVIIAQNNNDTVTLPKIVHHEREIMQNRDERGIHAR